jgi:hypothetical protein
MAESRATDPGSTARIPKPPESAPWRVQNWLGLDGGEHHETAANRGAATAGDGPAQLALALELLNGQPTAAQLSEVKLLLGQAAQSDDFYVMKRVAALLASSAVDAIRDPSAALLVAKRLEKNPIEADPQMFEALAVAYAANRDFWEAAAKEKTAIKKASVLRWNTQLMEQRYATYHHSQPWAGDVFSLPAAR